jgi:hypothetical protein
MFFKDYENVKGAFVHEGIVIVMYDQVYFLTKSSINYKAFMKLTKRSLKNIYLFF